MSVQPAVQLYRLLSPVDLKFVLAPSDKVELRSIANRLRLCGRGKENGSRAESESVFALGVELEPENMTTLFANSLE